MKDMTEQAVWESDKGVFLRVVVRPQSQEQNLIQEISETHVLVNLRGPARQGKANTELVKRLSKLLGLSTSQVIIVGGRKSREKILLIIDSQLDTISDVLQTCHKQ